MSHSNIFLSYSWTQSNVADEIDGKFQALGITFRRDIRDATYKKSLSGYMTTIRDADYVLFIISDAFLKSENCMFEVVELKKERNHKYKSLYIIIEDAKVYTPEYRINIIKYWQNRTNELEKQLKSLSLQNIGDELKTLEKYRDITNNVSNFLKSVSDDVSKRYSELKQNGFKDILDYIGYENNHKMKELFEAAIIKDLNERENAFDKFIFNYPKNYMGYYTKAYFSDNYIKRISNYTMAIQLDPKNAKLYNDRGHAKLKREEYDIAIEDFDTAIKIDPQSRLAYYNRGLAKQFKNEFNEALIDFDKAIEINPIDSDFYYDRGLIRHRLGQHKLALEDYDMSVSINPFNEQAYNNRAMIKTENGDSKEALEDYNKSINVNPKYAIALNNRGELKLNLIKDYEGAIKDFDTAINLESEFLYAILNRSQAKMKIGDIGEAISDLDKVITIDPQNASAFFSLSLNKGAIGKIDEARNDYYKSISLNPSLRDPKLEKLLKIS